MLIHAAGIIHPKRVREFYEVNRDGTRKLLEAATRSGVQRAVVVSSNSRVDATLIPNIFLTKILPAAHA